MALENTLADWYDRNVEGEDDHYTQPGMLCNKAIYEYDRHNLVSNIVGAMSGIDCLKKISLSTASYVIFSGQMCNWAWR